METQKSWLIKTSEVKPGGSAIIGGNRLAFFAIHHIALCLITVSAISSVIVILKIISGWRSSSVVLDFPLRFPLYLAVADVLWGISHFIDHMYLVTAQRFPDSQIVIDALSINLWLFFGYQHLMHASVAAYTYIRIIHRIRPDLGKWEWKLHLICWLFLAITIPTLYYFKAFGCSGYWMANDVTSNQGMILAGLAAMTATLNAYCTTFGYQSIKKKTMKTLESLMCTTPTPENVRSGPNLKGFKSTATQCLSTYVWVASCLYCPLAVLMWICVFIHVTTDSIEPVTTFLVVVVANSSGWANAYGYFQNERIRKERLKEKQIMLQFTSTENKSNDSQL